MTHELVIVKMKDLPFFKFSPAASPSRWHTHD